MGNLNNKGIKTGIYRSKFESSTADFLESQGVSFMYEEAKIDYVVPARDAKYTPDFVLGNGIIIETKGLFEAKDRHKHLLIKEQEPDLDIRFVFYDANKTITKKGKTTYAEWAEHNGFKWSNKIIPPEWLKEDKSYSYDYIKNVLKWY